MCGEVTGLGFNGDNVDNVIRVDVCVDGGDSGGPVFTLDGQAIGIISKAVNGRCSEDAENKALLAPRMDQLRAKVGQEYIVW